MACCGNKEARPFRMPQSGSDRRIAQTKETRQKAETPVKDTTRGADKIRGLKWTAQK